MGDRVRLCALEELQPGMARPFEVGSRRIAVVRIADDVFAVDDTCSHEEYSLSEGEVWVDEREIECPQHGSTFDLQTGEPRSLPATRPVAVYPVRLESGEVLVELS